MVRKILHTKKVREFHNFGTKLFGCGRFLSILSDWHPCIFFLAYFAHSALLQNNDHFRKCTKTLKDFIFELKISAVYFYVIELELIVYLLQDEEKPVQFSALWSGKKRIWSEKSQCILFVTEGDHPGCDIICSAQAACCRILRGMDTISGGNISVKIIFHTLWKRSLL